jgi:hypothetical protein
MNEKELIRRAMSALGKRKSLKKTKAVRRNAKLGGWPKGKKRKPLVAVREQKRKQKVSK